MKSSFKRAGGSCVPFHMLASVGSRIDLAQSCGKLVADLVQALRHTFELSHGKQMLTKTSKQMLTRKQTNARSGGVLLSTDHVRFPRLDFSSNNPLCVCTRACTDIEINIPNQIYSMIKMPS